MEIAGAADDSNTLITLGRRYIYDGWSVVEERTFDNSATLGNSPNTLERVYVNGRSIDEPLLAAIDGDGDGFLNSSKNTTNGVNIVDAEYYYLSNRLGSISAILDADNSDRILEYYRYEVFGSATVLPIVDNNTDGLEDTPFDLNDNNAAGPTLVSSFGNTYLYTARRFDDITGLYYYRNRYYDPRSGRFITRDPAKTPQGNLYSYSINNSSTYSDPMGLYPVEHADCPDSYMKCFEDLAQCIQDVMNAAMLTLQNFLNGIGPVPPNMGLLGFNQSMNSQVFAQNILEELEKWEDEYFKDEDLSFECKCCNSPMTSAYVYGNGAVNMFGDDEIHVCPRLFFDSCDDIVGTILHEVSHLVSGTDDISYRWETSSNDITPNSSSPHVPNGLYWGNLTSDQRWNNADSWAVFLEQFGGNCQCDCSAPRKHIASAMYKGGCFHPGYGPGSNPNVGCCENIDRWEG